MVQSRGGHRDRITQFPIFSAIHHICITQGYFCFQAEHFPVIHMEADVDSGAAVCVSRYLKGRIKQSCE